MAAKDEILLKLEENRGFYISGQAMADELQISRNAVWKAIEKLKEEGFEILSGNGGYMLSLDCDRYNKKRIEKLLDSPIELFLLPTIDSTNTECKRRLSSAKSDFAVLAEAQTGGRGRNGKEFYSPEEKGLYMSIALKRRLPLDSAVMITTYSAVCVVEELRRLTGLECEIKWVNDVFYDGLKVAGILTEAVTDLESGLLTDIIVGIGINLHPAKLPAKLKKIAGALDCKPIKNELVAALIEKLYNYDVDDRSHMERYRAYSMILGKQVSFVDKDETVYAMAVDIDDSGSLIVETPQGKKVLRGGEVSIVPVK